MWFLPLSMHISLKQCISGWAEVQACDKRMQCAVAPAVQGVQAAVQKGLDTQAASLTEHNDALAQLTALLEQLGAGKGAQQGQRGSQRCIAPCVDLRQHPILHSSACICAQGSLAGMRADADEAARRAGRALLGELSSPFLAHVSLFIWHRSHSLQETLARLLPKGSPAVVLREVQQQTTAHAARQGLL